MISITAFGRVPPGKMVHRSGAKPGDRVVVTGTIGDAALGLDVLKGGAARRCSRGRCRRQGDAGRALSHAAAAQRAGEGGSRSCQRRDGCVRRPCRRSRQALRGVRRVGRDRCAEHPAVAGGCERCCERRSSASRRWSAGGDDYEILCAIPEDQLRRPSRRQPPRPAGGRQPRSGPSSRARRRRRFWMRQGRDIPLAAPVLQPFLALSAESSDATANSCPNRRFRRSTALRPGCDFGMVPPI